MISWAILFDTPDRVWLNQGFFVSHFFLIPVPTVFFPLQTRLWWPQWYKRPWQPTIFSFCFHSCKKGLLYPQHLNKNWLLSPFLCFPTSEATIALFTMRRKQQELESEESACNAGDPGSISGSGRSLEKKIATHSSILAWKIPWMEELSGLQSMGLQKVRHDWATNTS